VSPFVAVYIVAFEAGQVIATVGVEVGTELDWVVWVEEPVWVIDELVRVNCVVWLTEEPRTVVLLDVEDMSWYKERPLGPPQVSAAFPLHAMLQRPSVARVEPARRLFPQ
jgi:hypothetical protein